MSRQYILRVGGPQVLIGDAVRLRAGGPVMTVYDIESEHRVYCNWLRGREMQTIALPVASLMRVPRAVASR